MRKAFFWKCGNQGMAGVFNFDFHLLLRWVVIKASTYQGTEPGRVIQGGYCAMKKKESAAPTHKFDQVAFKLLCFFHDYC